MTCCRLARGSVIAAAGAGAAFILTPVDKKWPLHSYVSDEGTAWLRMLDAELAHNLAITATSWGLTPKAPADDAILSTSVMGLGFGNPIGLAAGFDKNGEAIDGLLDLGFGFVEIGTITPLSQPGNERPRMFRLPEDNAVINRYGFNSDGMQQVYDRLVSRRESIGLSSTRGPLGINVGKNKVTSEDQASSDYSKVITKLGPFADYLVVNVSSPNTPGLRNLQKRDLLTNLLKNLVTTRNELTNKPPLVVKVAPDLSDDEIKDIAGAAMDAKIDGIIVSNTTISRPEYLKSENKKETGGLSGAPVRDLSTAVIHKMSKATSSKLPIIGVGGVANGQHAFDKIVCGASLVQMYSMLAYIGPSAAYTANTELAAILKKHGFKSVSEAVGAAHKNPELLPSHLKTTNA
eukprot:TRINITY_DN1503_c3_g1_i1.p1 TRINITY_DN1503_c3_g1~~TRINITY_DN1503_c3_g1_i1.p1  ORF type:complete len:405 (+),score=86.35 TRINITY_DN1503_c3_g1_i1:55-1269(+)